jgi:hypothetical protein
LPNKHPRPSANHGQVATAALHEIDRSIHGNSRNPGRKAGILPKRRQLVIRTQKRLLRCLFRIGLIARNAKGDAEHRLKIAVDQNAIFVAVAGKNLPDRVDL